MSVKPISKRKHNRSEDVSLPTGLFNHEHSFTKKIIRSIKKDADIFETWALRDVIKPALIDLPGVTQEDVDKLKIADVHSVHQLLGRYFWDAETFYPWLVDDVHIAPTTVMKIIFAFAMKLHTSYCCCDNYFDDL